MRCCRIPSTAGPRIAVPAIPAGNVERFFPLLLAVSILGGTSAVAAWHAVDSDRLPPVQGAVERAAGITLLLLAAFLAFGTHLPMLPDALSGHPTRVEYLSSPTAFWLVKLMDLGILVPVATAVGVGLLRHRPSARKAMYAVMGGYSLIGASVAAMALVMLASEDPDASVVLAVGFCTFAAAFAGLTGALYRPLFARAPEGGDELPRVRRSTATATVAGAAPAE